MAPKTAYEKIKRCGFRLDWFTILCKDFDLTLDFMYEAFAGLLKYSDSEKPFNLYDDFNLLKKIILILKEENQFLFAHCMNSFSKKRYIASEQHMFSIYKNFTSSRNGIGFREAYSIPDAYMLKYNAYMW